MAATINSIVANPGGSSTPIVGQNYTKLLFPLNQTGLSTVLPTDYSGNSVTVVSGGTVGGATQPWANAGYYTSHFDGGSKQNYFQIPNSAINCNFSIDSFVFGVTINKATPAGTETILGSSDGTSTVGLNVNINSTGKVGPRILVNGAFVATTYGTATAANGADHRVLITWDAPSKTLSLYVDGTLDITQVAGTVLSTDIQASAMRIGQAMVGASVDCKFAGLEFLTFPASALPINMVELALSDNDHRRTGLIGEPVFL